MGPRRQLAVTLAVLGTIGLVVFTLLFAGVYVAGESTRGRVVEVALDHRTCRPIVEYTVAGTRHRASTRIGTAPCPHEVGDTVTVYYWPRRPEVPTLFSFGALLPLFGCALVLVAAAVIGLRRPTLAERVEETLEHDAASAPEGAIVKLRGTIELAPEASAMSAPLTERSCVAYWARVVVREPGEPDRKARDASGWTDAVVRTRDGDARISASTPVRLAIDADARGESDHAGCDALEAFLERDPSNHHHVWYEGLFREGEEIFAVGRARRDEHGALELVAGEDDHVVLEHVRRDERKRASRRFV